MSSCYGKARGRRELSLREVILGTGVGVQHHAADFASELPVQSMIARMKIERDAAAAEYGPIPIDVVFDYLKA
jgi:hypothetical protein